MNFDEYSVKFINCPECGRKIPKENFCIYCGIRLENNAIWIDNSSKAEFKDNYKKCPRCGEVVKKEAHYCWYCGIEL